MPLQDFTPQDSTTWTQWMAPVLMTITILGVTWYISQSNKQQVIDVLTTEYNKLYTQYFNLIVSNAATTNTQLINLNTQLTELRAKIDAINTIPP